MSQNPKRLLAAGIAAAIALFGLIAAPSAQAAPTSCDGVWVVVQADEENPGTITIDCATEYGSGVAALTSAGSTYGESGGFVNQIDGLPTDPDFGTNGGYYWSYFHATVA
ncbi:MAG: hypothetical protein IT193_18560, partial [Propionibacteriaceae bacterium]|nr:hypothetical protein [Propionibacteriaceae bacterium]